MVRCILTEIVGKVTKPSGKTFFRPNIKSLGKIPEYIGACMSDCWEEIAEARPDFKTIRTRLKPLRKGM